MGKPVFSSKHDQSRLEKAAKMAEAEGNKAAAKRIRRIIKQRTERDAKRALEYKKAQADPYTRYNPNGPN
jgi:hypothetical protein